MVTAERSHGPIESAARSDVADLGELAGVQGTLAQTAYRLAAALDAGARGMAIAATAKELRETLAALSSQSDTEEAIKRLLAELATPVGEGDGG